MSEHFRKPNKTDQPNETPWRKLLIAVAAVFVLLGLAFRFLPDRACMWLAFGIAGVVFVGSMGSSRKGRN